MRPPANCGAACNCSAPPLPTADSGLLGASQASAATRDKVAGESGAPVAVPAAGCSPQTLPAASLQAVFSDSDKVSDKGSDVGAGSGSGSGGRSSSGGANNLERLSGGSDSVDGSGDGSGGGSGSEQQSLSDEQAFSTPTQPCSRLDNPSLPGKDRPCLKRCSPPLCPSLSVRVSCVLCAGALSSVRRQDAAVLHPRQAPPAAQPTG